jgi:hypothetical protein
VYTASINAFQNLGLEVFKTDEQAGYIEGGRKPAFGQGSETVGIFLGRTSPTTTSVQIDNNRAMLGYIFSKDWTDELFNQIASELGE